MEKRQEMLQMLKGKIEELTTAKSKLTLFVEKMETEQENDKVAISALEAELISLKEAQTMAVDVSEAKLLKNQITELVEDLELHKTVLTAKENKAKQEMAEVATDVLKTYNQTKFVYSTVDAHFTVTASMLSIDEDIQTMNALGHQIDMGVSYAKTVLIKYGIISQGESTFSGVYLNSTGCHTRANQVRVKLSTLMSDYRAQRLL
ncbi:hypothetical protein [Priestia megaterium]|uniref:hypothetical protein n=1 Tax=Priestia megaterium TaxID=1404 RepID=UPI000BA4E894|nr:hypothetical protein [Priestia megaterium]PAK50096.1 hypothetical protein CHH47_11300 [Priestia megaterium]